MKREQLIKKTVSNLKRLSEDKLQEISDFAEFLLAKYEADIIEKGMQKISSESKSLKFLNEEEDLYTVKDLKEVYS